MALLLMLAVIVVLAVVVLRDAHTAAGNKAPGSKSATHASKQSSPATAAASSSTPDPSASFTWTGPPSDKLHLKRTHIIYGTISPKSVVATQTGLIFAQNMMYRHTMTVYSDSAYKLIKTIRDSVKLAKLGVKGYAGTVQGAPVEAAVTPHRQSIYISNYSMYGPGFYHEGHDAGGPGSGYDPSFVYRVNLNSLKVDQAIKVGSVPKFLEVTPNGRYLLVSNWASYTLSVCDPRGKGHQIRQIYLGPNPRGIAVDPQSRYAYVAVMGSTGIAKIDLQTFKKTTIYAGSGPRHLCMSPHGRWLYVTLNGEGRVAKIDLKTDHVVDTVATGAQPRSMTMAPDGKSLYVVNYVSNTFSKVRTSDMRVLQELSTNSSPIGITYDWAHRDVWVSCYSGSLMVFHDH
ncbi:MAG: YncE family protein [Armatimonadota bacterium]